MTHHDDPLPDRDPTKPYFDPPLTPDERRRGVPDPYPPHDPEMAVCGCIDCCEAEWQRQQDAAASEPRDYRRPINKREMRKRE